MPTTTVAGRQLHVDAEGYLLDAAEWDDDVATALAAQLGITLTDRHWAALRCVRGDYERQGQAPPIRRVSLLTGIPVGEIFSLFGRKPAKKLAYLAGLPRPQGYV